MPRLTNEAKEIIRKNKDNEDLSLADFRSIIQKKLNETYSRQGISNFLKALPSKSILTKLDNKLDNKITRPSIPRTRKKFRLSVDTLKRLLDENLDNYWHDYVEEQFIGKNGKAGKLRSDFQKLCEFLEDVT